MHIGEYDVLVLTTCTSDGISNEGFEYSLHVGAPVDFPTWDPNPVRDRGLYGLPWGVGSIRRLLSNSDSLWLLIKVNKKNYYIHGIGDFTEECKFRFGTIYYIGDCYGAIKVLQDEAPRKTPIVLATQREQDSTEQIAGDYSVQYAEKFSIQTSGDYSFQRATDCAIQTSEDCSIQKAGHHSTQTAGTFVIQNADRCSTQYASMNSVQISEDDSVQRADTNSYQIASEKAIQIADSYSVQVSGNNSKQEAGCFSVQITKNNSMQRAKEGTVQITHWFTGTGKPQVATRIVTKEMAGKMYKVSYGEWTEIPEMCVNFMSLNSLYNISD